MAFGTGQVDNWSGGDCRRPATYTVGGTVSGLTGTVVLQDNGGDNLSVTANGAFTFATPLASGAAYNVTVKTNPAGQTCTVANGSGTMPPPTSPTCRHLHHNPTYTVGGTVSRAGRHRGPAGQRRRQPQRHRQRRVHLRHPAGRRRRLRVTVKTNPPARPAPSPTAPAPSPRPTSPTSPSPAPANPRYTVGGTVSAACPGTVVLAGQRRRQPDASPPTARSPSPPRSPAGPPTAVTVKTSPAGQTCTVANGTGTMRPANITNVRSPARPIPRIYRSAAPSQRPVRDRRSCRTTAATTCTVTANGPFTFATALASGRRLRRHRQDQPGRADLHRHQRHRHHRRGQRHQRRRRLHDQPHLHRRRHRLRACRAPWSCRTTAATT